MAESQSILNELTKLADSFIPLFNSWLQQAGFMIVPSRTPTAVVIDNFGRFQHYLEAFSGKSGILEQDKRDVRNAIVGLIESVSPGFREQLERGELSPETKQQMDQIVNNFTTMYPLLASSSPQLAQMLNPRSRINLALELSSLFAQYPVAMTPEETAAIATEATNRIINNPRYHKGFTSQEIAVLARRGFMEGLITGGSPEQITDQIIGVINLIAPIRDFAAATGHDFSPEEGVKIVKLLQSRFPSLSYEELAKNIWTWSKVGQAGGMYRIALIPGAVPTELQEIIRRSGVPPEQLEEQSSQLMVRGARSFLGSAAGAVIRAVHTGLVRPGTPAYRLYMDIINGRPMQIRTPMEVASILTQSGIRPDVAAMMLTQRAQNQYYMTPGAMLSIRLTQYQIDWAPRFAMVARMFPATDPQSAEIQRGVLSEMVSRAGYNNIEHFMALHAVTPFADIWRTMSQAGANASLVSGMHNLRTFRGVSYLTATLQDIGEGKKDTLTISDVLRTIFSALPTDEAAIPVRPTGLFGELPPETKRVVQGPGTEARFPWVPEPSFKPIRQEPVQPVQPAQPVQQPAPQPKNVPPQTSALQMQQPGNQLQSATAQTTTSSASTLANQSVGEISFEPSGKQTEVS